jgi:hypothetical protein
MKQILVVAIALIASLSSMAQDLRPLPIDSFYQKKEDLLIYSKVIDFNGKSKTEIINGFKNWGSTNFVNLKEITVSESEDQIVLNYITKQMYVKFLGSTSTCEWYVRLIAEFKEGKMRVSFIDDGNTFWPGNQYAPATRARIYNLSMYFKDGEPLKKAHGGLINFKDVIVNVANSIKIVEQKKSNDNW